MEEPFERLDISYRETMSEGPPDVQNLTPDEANRYELSPDFPSPFPALFSFSVAPGPLSKCLPILC